MASSRSLVCDNAWTGDRSLVLVRRRKTDLSRIDQTREFGLCTLDDMESVLGGRDSPFLAIWRKRGIPINLRFLDGVSWSVRIPGTYISLLSSTMFPYHSGLLA